MFKKIYKLILVLVVSLLLVGCGFLFDFLAETDFKFLHEISEIKSIEIVIIGEVERIENFSPESSVVVDNPNFDVVCYVQNIEQFIDDFSKVECFTSFPPRSPSLGDIGIKIIYNNEDYDIICSSGQGEYRDGFYYSDSGKFSFDENQFDELINKYTDNIKTIDTML